MKKRRSGVILMMLGIIMAAAVGATVFLTTQKASSETHINMVEVLVVAQEIPERTIIEPASLAKKSVPADIVPSGALTKIEQASGKMTTARLYPGELLLSSKLANTQGQSGVSYTLEKGQVVITFPASDIVTTGALRPGDTVDVLVTLQPATNGSGSKPILDSLSMATTQLTLQNLKILAIGTVGAQAGATQAQGKGKEASSLLTFAVSHEDALVLKALKDSPNAILEIALRAAGDDQKVDTDAVTLPDIIDKYRVR